MTTGEAAPVPDQSAPRHGADMRPLVEFLLVLFLAALVFRGFVAEGYYVPTGSMAPGLLGYHVEAVCPDCGYKFPVGCDESGWLRPQIKCPICRGSQAVIKSEEPETGDRLFVLKSLYSLRNPHRWETVVFNNPNDTGDPYVKRVVGLPGEHVTLREGNVYINNKIARKSLAQLTHVALPVYIHEIAVRNPKGPARFEPVGSECSWHFGVEPLTVESMGSREEHAIRYRHVDLDGHEAVIRDDNSYNDRQEPRFAEGVEDLVVSCQIRGKGPGYFLLRYQPRAEYWTELVIHPSRGRVELRRSAAEPAVASVPVPSDGVYSLKLAVWDRQIAMSCNEKLAVPIVELPDNAHGAPTSSRPILLAVRDWNGEVDHFRIDRDIHYRDIPPSGRLLHQEDGFHLADSEYLLLGDNSAISNDSRSWKIPAITRDYMVGKPVLVHLPTRTWRFEMLGRSFRVSLPDPSRMRLVH